MFLQRDFSNFLQKWKEDGRRKPLVIRGARQVGKSSIVRRLGESFDNYIEINFERSPEYKRVFDGSLAPKEILKVLELGTATKIEVGKTLVFFDEVQECPRALTALRYFYEELPDLHVISAGSLMQLAFKEEGIPVGRVSFGYMHPLSFYEFLSALQRDNLREFIENHKLDKNIPEVIHAEIVSSMKLYYLIGGMPESVKVYKSTGSIGGSLEVLVDLLTTFRRDFRKYTKEKYIPFVDEVFHSVPRLLGENFKYTKVNPHIRSEYIRNASQLLMEADIINPVFHTSAAGIPLNATKNPKKFKLTFLDIALSLKILGLNTEAVATTNPDEFISKGALAEQFVAQEIIANCNPRVPPELFFWQREKKSSSAEVDFLLESNSEIIPLEVKSGNRRRSKSLEIFIKENRANKAFILSSKNTISKDGPTKALPIYFAGRLRDCLI